MADTKSIEKILRDGGVGVMPTNTIYGLVGSEVTLEKTRQNLLEVLKGWVVLCLKRGIPVPGLKFSTTAGISKRDWMKS